MDMTPKVSVETTGGTKYRITIDDGKTKTVHEVTVTPTSIKRYGQGAKAEDLLEASFRFLLERESKESILARFDLSEIETYFPDYEATIRGMLRVQRGQPLIPE
jgi:hypothetical protein